MKRLFGLFLAGIVLSGCAQRSRQTSVVVPPQQPTPSPFVQGNPPPGAIMVPQNQFPIAQPAPGYPPTQPSFQQPTQPSFQQQAPPMQPNFQQQAPPMQPSFPSAPPTQPSFPSSPPGPMGFSGPGPGSVEQTNYTWRPATGYAPAYPPSAILTPPPPPPMPNPPIPSSTPTPPVAPQFDAQVLLLPPQPVDQGPSYYPETSPPPKNTSSKEPPVSIPKFATVRKNIETGLKPLGAEGFDWLKSNGYKTVFYLRSPGENIDAERKLVEDRLMTFKSVEINPSLLVKDSAEEFFRIVQDANYQPMYVYGREEALTGGMWYLTFRLLDKESDDVARVRSGPLGFRAGAGTPDMMIQAVAKAMKGEW